MLEHYVLQISLYLPKTITRLSSSTRDEEPLVNGRIDRRWCEVLVAWNRWELVWADTVLARVLDCQVGGGDVSWLSLTSDELLPSFGTLTDDVGGVSLMAL